MDKFEEYFRATKHYENMLLEIARNQLSVSVFDKNGRKYRNHIVQTAYEVFQHQQAKVEELQAKVDGLLGLVKYDSEYQAKLLDERDVIRKQVDDLTIERDELQKRVDAAKHYLGNIFTGNSIEDECHLKDLLDILDGKIVEELEQALKGEGQ